MRLLYLLIWLLSHRQPKYNSPTQLTNTRDDNVEDEFETRTRISENLYGKVESRLNRLDLISDYKVRKRSCLKIQKPPFVLLTTMMLVRLITLLTFFTCDVNRMKEKLQWLGTFPLFSLTTVTLPPQYPLHFNISS